MDTTPDAAFDGIAVRFMRGMPRTLLDLEESLGRWLERHPDVAAWLDGRSLADVVGERLVVPRTLVPVLDGDGLWALADETVELPDGSRVHGELVERTRPVPGAVADGAEYLVVTFRALAADPPDLVGDSPNDLFHRVYCGHAPVGPTYGRYESALLLVAACLAGRPGDDPRMLVEMAGRLLAPRCGGGRF